MCMSINKQQVNNTADSTVGTQAHDLAYRIPSCDPRLCHSFLIIEHG
jgi:hypothetical protein